MSGVFRPDGYRPGLPIVSVEEDVVEQNGAIEVSYDGLDELYRRDLRAPADITPHLWFDENITSSLCGRYEYFSRIMYVNPTMSFKYLGADGVTLVMLHEGRHFADAARQPIKFGGEMILSQAATSLARLVWDEMTAEGLHYKFSPHERRAIATEHDADLLRKYRNVVSFSGWQNFLGDEVLPLATPALREVA